MSDFAWGRIAAWAAAFCALGGFAGLPVTQAGAEPGGREPRLDVVGGCTSQEIIVRFNPETMVRVKPLRTMHRSTGRAAVPSALSPRLRSLYTKWGGLRLRPAYPFEFKHPELAARYGLDRTFVIEVPRGTNTPAMAAAFCDCSEDIESAGVSTIGDVAEFIPNDQDFGEQYALHNLGRQFPTYWTYDADIDAPEAWDLHTGRFGTVTIAIIDSGVGPHVEFAGRMVPGINTHDPSNPDLTIDGHSDGHGTHVAGIAAAEGNNGIGVAGVTWGAYIMPVRVMGPNAPSTPTVAASGLIWAAENGADICNLSLQYYDLSTTEEQTFIGAVNAAHDLGALVIAAAGNLRYYGSNVIEHDVAAPARFPNYVMAVSATDANDQLWGIGGVFGSNWGPEVDLCAAGKGVYSTKPNDNYDELSGTSMAAPHVSGLAALIKSYAYYLTNDEIWTILTSTTDDLGSAGWDDHYGWGRINAFTALLDVTPSIAVESGDPPNGAIDARQPFSINGSNPDGWRSVDVTFDGPAAGLVKEDFEISFDPPRAGPDIFLVTPVGNTATVELTTFIPVGAWTTITHLDSNTSTTLGYLPTDVDGNGQSNTDDILALIDAINNVGDPLPIRSTDLDRSSLTTARDLTRGIDLLNGAGAYDPFLGVSLP